jgi:hypothetical protein
MIRAERIVANWLIKAHLTRAKNIQIVVVGYRSRSHQHSAALDQQLRVLIRKGPPCHSQEKCHHPCPREELALGGAICKERKIMNLVSFCQQSNGARLLKDCCLCNLLIFFWEKLPAAPLSLLILIRMRRMRGYWLFLTVGYICSYQSSNLIIKAWGLPHYGLFYILYW